MLYILLWYYYLEVGVWRGYNKRKEYNTMFFLCMNVGEQNVFITGQYKFYSVILYDKKGRQMRTEKKEKWDKTDTLKTVSYDCFILSTGNHIKA